jgi:hypothetical protein
MGYKDKHDKNHTVLHRGGRRHGEFGAKFAANLMSSRQVLDGNRRGRWSDASSAVTS